MNFFIHLATPAANLILVIGRRLTVKSAVGIYEGREIRSAQTSWALFVLPLNAKANIQQAFREGSSVGPMVGSG
jgi:hypothetical protein